MNKKTFTPNTWKMSARDYAILQAMLANIYIFLDDARKGTDLLPSPTVVETVLHIEQVEG